VLAGLTRLAAGRAFRLWLLAATVFLVFFQSQAIAPLVPALAADFGAPVNLVGFLVPLYAFPYGLVALIYGPLSDRFGRQRTVALCMGALACSTLGTALAPSLAVLTPFRLIAGLSAGGVMPVALAYTADLYAYRERGRAIGVVFGGLTMGQATGYSLGPILEAWIGWRALYGALGLAVGLILLLLLLSAPKPASPPAPPATTPPPARGFRYVLALPRAWRIYTFLILCGMTGSGVTAWFGVYVYEVYSLQSLAIGLAYLAHGAVGLLSPAAGALADRLGRGRLIPTGQALIALGALLLALQGPFGLALVAIAVVAVGLQLTYPLLAGLASELAPEARGYALGLNTFSMYMGISSGSALVGALLPLGTAVAFGTAAAIAAVGALAALPLLRREH
jgi:predicted MFS family arabinose efflux permease